MTNRFLRAALILGVAAAAAEPFLFAGSFAGDAQVHLVFAESASHGRFFEFNPGERVSGETSPGYMLLEAALFHVFAPRMVPVAVKVLNLATWYLFCFIVYRVACRMLSEPGDADRTWPAIAAIMAALVPGSVYNANVGMENGLFALLVWIWVDCAHQWRWFESERQSHLAAELSFGGLLGLACWFRPEAWLLGTAAFAFQLLVNEGSIASCIPAALSMVVVGATCVAFQYVCTGDIIATSILSRRILALKEQISVGPLWVDPTFAKRLVVYAPLTLFSAIGLGRRVQAGGQLLRFLGSLLVLFFGFYTLTGAPQLGRYMIFLVPILALAGANGARSVWDGRSTRGRVLVIVSAVAMAGIDVGELTTRRSTHSRKLLALAMTAPGNRQSRTDQLLRELGSPSPTPVIFAEEPIQQRYEFDGRILIRSLDGRTDRSLLSFVHDGKVDHPGYLKSEHVDFLAAPVDYDRGPGPATLSALEPLADGASARLGSLVFRRLPSGRFAVADVQERQPPPWSR